jgi:hypothetical protein
MEAAGTSARLPMREWLGATVARRVNAQPLALVHLKIANANRSMLVAGLEPAALSKRPRH